MKNAIIIFFLCILSLTAFSQQYYPLVEENRSWNVMIVVPDWSQPFDSSCYTDTYFISGDSTLNTIDYKKFYFSNEETPVNWTLIGFIREDGAKRVWYRRIVDTTEVLLYDFSVLSGDSLKIGVDTTFYYKVDSITTEIVADSLRKKYWISQDDYYWHETWIEGVGSNKGITGSAMASAVGGWSWLLCMSDDGNLIYMYPYFNSCYINTGLNETQNPVFRIYPNPVADRITLDSFDAGTNLSEITISVYNSTGVKIACKAEPDNNQLSIDFSNESGGIFYLIIENKGVTLQTQKILKL